MWCQVATQGLAGGVVGACLEEVLEQRVGATEEDLLAGPAGDVTEGGGEEGLADADGPHEQDVLVAVQEAQAEEVPDAVAVEGDGGVPVEALESLLLSEAGLVDAQGEALAFPPVDLILEGKFQEVLMRELGLLRVGEPVGQGVEDGREPEALEHGLDRVTDLHGDVPPRRRRCG